MDELTRLYRWDIRPQVPSRPPWFKTWPTGAKLAFQVIVLHEWESNPWHRSRPMPANSHYKFDFLSLGGREYGARHGIWRLLDVLEGHDVKATVLANGIMAELFPDSVRAAAERGHEIAAHQWDQAIFPTMFTSRDEECASLSKTKAVLERVAKHPVVGYMSPGPRSTPHTVEILAELDFSWACEYVDSDFPYLIPVGGKDIVAISYATPGCIDFDLLLRGLNDRLEELKITFAAAYKEADRHPMKFCYAVHTHWGGTVGMAWVLEQFLSYVRRHEGVWYPRHSEMADFWLQQTRANHR